MKCEDHKGVEPTVSIKTQTLIQINRTISSALSCSAQDLKYSLLINRDSYLSAHALMN